MPVSTRKAARHPPRFKRIFRSRETIVLISHDMEAVARTADRLLIMSEGRVLAFASPEEIFSNEELLSQASLSLPATVEFLNILKADYPELLTNAYSAEEGLYAL